jgi:hypothetical protein
MFPEVTDNAGQFQGFRGIAGQRRTSAQDREQARARRETETQVEMSYLIRAHGWTPPFLSARYASDPLNRTIHHLAEKWQDRSFRLLA